MSREAASAQRVAARSRRSNGRARRKVSATPGTATEILQGVGVSQAHLRLVRQILRLQGGATGKPARTKAAPKKASAKKAVRKKAARKKAARKKGSRKK